MILVTGGNGVVGKPLCETLKGLQTEFMLVSRRRSRTANSGKCLQWDLESPPSEHLKSQLENIETLLHCAPIWFLPPHLEVLKQAGVNRIIAFSSTSVLSKQNSNGVEEQHLVALLSKAEESLLSFCHSNSIDLTIFRPTMIYGYGRDQNVSKLANFIRRFRCMVLVGKATGLRQPVHADDLVNATVESLSNTKTFNKVYNLAGAEELTYRRMVERIFLALNKTPIILVLPLNIYRWALRIAASLSNFSYTAEMANRMSQNLVYDYSQATEDFGYQPQPFLANPARDIVDLANLQKS